MIKNIVKICLIATVFFTFAQSAVFAQLSSAGVPLARPPATVSVSEVGDVKIKNAVVFMISGNTIFVRTYWDDAFIRWTVRVNEKTEVLKKFGGKIKVSDIKVGDVINTDGKMLTGADSLDINASVVRDLNLEKEGGTFSGKVTRANDGTGTFVLTTNDGKSLTIKVNGGTTIKKGMIFIALSNLNYGDTILSVEGSYHQPTETVEATNIEVYQTKKIFEPRNFEGKLESLSGTELPVTMVVSVGDTSYTVFLPAGSQVLNAKKNPAKLQRFVLGDTVRFYGKIQETNLTVVDAEVVRNLDL